MVKTFFSFEFPQLVFSNPSRAINELFFFKLRPIDSYILPGFEHAAPTLLLSKIIHALAEIFPFRHVSKLLIKVIRRDVKLCLCMTYLSLRLQVWFTSSWDVTQRYLFLCQKCLYTLCLLRCIKIRNQNLFWSYGIGKWVWPFFVNTLLHNLLISPWFLLENESHLFPIKDYFSLVMILGSFPLKMIVGSTPSVPSANTVSCTVNLR